jgi:hypothetical protein
MDHRGYALFGIFRAEVSGEDILFRHNKRNVYTFIDLQHAKALGFQVELIQNGSPNALVQSPLSTANLDIANNTI